MAQIKKRTIKNGETRYDVRTRIAGRVVTKTFTRRRDADAYASTTAADKLRGVVIDPRRAKVSVREYSDQWLAGRNDLALRTTETYRYLLDRYIFPTFGNVSLSRLSPSVVRSWHADIFKDHPTTAAKAYRLLREILNTALADEIIARNPCQVKGAGQENAPERPVASVAEVEALAVAMPQHLRIAVLLAAWCQLRRGELLGLRRRDVDLLRGTLTVEVTRITTMGGKIVSKEPKTDAGRRTLTIPANIVSDLQHHLNTCVRPEPDAPVLVGKMGAAVTPGVLQINWNRARKAVGRPDLRLHDLRHAGLTWSAATGATTKELMRRAGHKSSVAALRYQHATEDRDKVLAAALAELAPTAEVVPIGRQRAQ